MDNIVKEFAKNPLSGDELLKLVDRKANLYRNSDLKRFNSIEEALRPYGAMFILYEKDKNYGHWVLVFRSGDTIEYFDPYGFQIDYPIKKFNNGYPHVGEMLIKFAQKGGSVIHNPVRLQKLSSNISSCGRWCAMRLLLRDMPLDRFINLFKNSKMSGDEYVTLLTMFVE